MRKIKTAIKNIPNGASNYLKSNNEKSLKLFRIILAGVTPSLTLKVLFFDKENPKTHMFGAPAFAFWLGIGYTEITGNLYAATRDFKENVPAIFCPSKTVKNTFILGRGQKALISSSAILKSTSAALRMVAAALATGGAITEGSGNYLQGKDMTNPAPYLFCVNFALVAIAKGLDITAAYITKAATGKAPAKGAIFSAGKALLSCAMMTFGVSSLMSIATNRVYQVIAAPFLAIGGILNASEDIVGSCKAPVKQIGGKNSIFAIKLNDDSESDEGVREEVQLIKSSAVYS